MLEVKEGDSVKKGALLVRVDTDDYSIALDRAMAAYKLAKTDYERDKAVYDKGIIPAARMDIKETTNIADKYPERAEKMKEAIEQWKKNINPI